MKRLHTLRILSGCVLLSLSGALAAKTYTYDLLNPMGHTMEFEFPGLDVRGVKSAVITINRTSQNPEVELRALEVTYLNAAKLRTGVFKKVGPGRYRALVDGPWVFKQVIVEVDTDDSFTPSRHFNARLFVTNQVSLTNPESANQGVPFAGVVGQLRDVTYSPNSDSQSTTLDGKRVTLNLRDRLSAPSPTNLPGMFPPLDQPSFVIDTLWLGRGQKLLYLPAPVTWQDLERFEPIGLVLEGPTTDPLVRVRVRDAQGIEMLLPGQPLRMLLNTAFGPIAP